MNQSLAHPHPPWPWPVPLTSYDRSPDFSPAERAALVQLVSRPHFQVHLAAGRGLQRLVQPLRDVLSVIRADPTTRNDTVRAMLIEMQQRGQPFWAWSAADWLEVIGPNYTAFASRYGRSYGPNQQPPARRALPVVAYLLDAPVPLDPLLAPFALAPIARKVFGAATLEAGVQRLTSVLTGWGYWEKHHSGFTACVSYLLLRNHSPYLEDLTVELLEETKQSCPFACVQDYLFQVSRALAALGLISQPLADPRRATPPGEPDPDDPIAATWLVWCQRWRDQSTAQEKGHTYYQLLKVGRWLKQQHPEVTSPAELTYEVAAEFVAAVMEMRVGEWISAQKRARLPVERLGQPLRPNARIRLLKSLRVFVRDCQEWGWMPVRLNPGRALRTPTSLGHLIGPEPRVIDKDRWAKLLWAAMHLQADDLPVNGSEVLVYPLEMVRAIAVVWCFAALRSDEIVRLRVGCIRWQHDDVMVPETGAVLPKDAACFLDVPVNKTMTAYTKPVHPLVGQRINEWERLRPPEQPRQVDGKTSETVQFLFAYRGMPISKGYLNRCLIPHLCRKANIPEQDSRGAITSHRARATIASMLYNAKVPLDIFQLKEYLGHKHLASTQHYLKVDPTRLASQVAQAGYLEQNLATIEVLLDQEAVMSGAAARGESWKYYDLGHGYCTNPFWAECAHRMACARCPYYCPKDALKPHLHEGQANLVRLQEFVSLTEEERLLVTEGIALHQTLIEKLADVPTPVRPTPRALQTSQPREIPVIPLQAVQLTAEKRTKITSGDLTFDYT
jgi:integrase